MDAAWMSDVRAVLVTQVLDFVGELPAEKREQLRRRALELVEQTSDAELEQLVERVRREDYDFCYHPPFDLARQVHYAMADSVLSLDSQLEGRELLQSVASRRLLLLPNHLSYSDANLIAILFHRAGFDTLCSRLTVIAGPKVYSDPQRRFSSLCFGTIKTAQSSGRASGEAVMRPREVAAIARRTILATFERLNAGDALLVFPEGARSRDGGLQPLLPAVARYCELPDLWIVPLGVTGTESLLGFSDTRVQSTRVIVRVGTPLAAAELRERCGGNRAMVAESLGKMIAACLPEGYRGVYG